VGPTPRPVGHADLGWRMLGAMTAATLIAATTLACGRDAAHERDCTVTPTPAGLVYATLRRPRAARQSPPEAPPSKRTRSKAARPGVRSGRDVVVALGTGVARGLTPYSRSAP
jgi:hypothetical protein